MVEKRGKKRGGAASYVNRNQQLSESKKLPNVLQKAIAVPYEKPKMHGYISRFEYRLTVSGEPDILDALVLGNGVCVLVLKQPISGGAIRSVTFSDNFRTTDNISGKMKKGATLVKAGAEVCTLMFSVATLHATEASGSPAGNVNYPSNLTLPGAISDHNDEAAIDLANEKEYTCLKFRTPVGGKVLEINDVISRDFSLLQSLTDFDQSGYVCVIYPNTEIPRADGPRNWEMLVDQVQHNLIMKNLCFAFVKGNCTKGDSCKFVHEALESPQLDTNKTTGTESPAEVLNGAVQHDISSSVQLPANLPKRPKTML